MVDACTQLVGRIASREVNKPSKGINIKGVKWQANALSVYLDHQEFPSAKISAASGNDLVVLCFIGGECSQLFKMDLKIS